MTIVEQIHQQVQTFPENFQREALKFIRYLAFKLQQEDTGQIDSEEAWSTFSLNMAMRGMEEEDGPNYEIEDLKEVFA